MSDNRKTQNELDILDELLIEDILEATDEEIMQQAKSENIDLKEDAASTIQPMINALTLYRKNRLKKAKESFRLRNTNSSSKVLRIDSFEQKKNLFNKIEAKGQLTMAARNHNNEQLTENDLDLFLQRALKFGIIDEDGNSSCDD